MRFSDWLKPGIKVKRWVVFGIFGILLIAFGFTELVTKRLYDFYYKMFYIFLNLSGLFVIYISVTEAMKSIIVLVNKGYIKVSLDSKKIESMIYEKRLLVRGPKIVVIGGGTGLSTMLRGLKYYTSNITAIVTVGDDGGGSGTLREDLGILPPGDIRNCILALADTEPLMEDLLQYRFKDGTLKGQSFGNLFLAAMDGISDNFEDAVQKMSSVLAVTGKVLPVTLDDMQLEAILENGNKVVGESQIPVEALNQKSKIKKLMINPENAEPLKDALDAIKEADAIVIGPGSLYTSIIPNLLVKKIRTSVRKSDAIKIYVSNIMTQPGETDNFDVSDHVKIIKKYGGKEIVDYVIANSGEISEEIKSRYLEEGSTLAKLDIDNLKDIHDKNDKKRKELAKIGYEMISEKIIEFTEWLDSIKIDPTIESLNDKCLEIREDTLEYIYRKTNLNNRDKKIIDKMLTSALKRLIREPIINLKQTKDKGKREEYIKLVEELFEL